MPVQNSKFKRESFSTTKKLKIDLCRQIVGHVLESGATRREFSEKTGIELSALNDILKYRVDFISLESLISDVEKIQPELEIFVKGPLAVPS